MRQIHVESKIFGVSDQNNKLPDIVLSIETSKISVHDLISCSVTVQIDELLEKQHQSHVQARALLDRYFIGEQDLCKQIESGKVALSRPRLRAPDEIDTDLEIGRALSAFRSGVFAIFIDGRHFDNLDEQVALSDVMKVQFLRMTPLVGG